MFRSPRATYRKACAVWQCPADHVVHSLFPAAAFVQTDVPTTMRHMRAADVLVHTGSSFVTAAALAAPRTLLYIQAPSKENTEAVGQAVGAVPGIRTDSEVFSLLPSRSADNVALCLDIAARVSKSVRACLDENG